MLVIYCGKLPLKVYQKDSVHKVVQSRASSPILLLTKNMTHDKMTKGKYPSLRYYAAPYTSPNTPKISIPTLRGDRGSTMQFLSATKRKKTNKRQNLSIS